MVRVPVLAAVNLYQVLFDSDSTTPNPVLLLSRQVLSASSFMLPGPVTLSTWKGALLHRIVPEIQSPFGEPAGL